LQREKAEVERKGAVMKEYYTENIIGDIAESIQLLEEKKAIDHAKEIVIYGLDHWGYAIKTILANAGYRITGYVDDDVAKVIEIRRKAKGMVARYVNGTENALGVYLPEEKLKEDVSNRIILTASVKIDKIKNILSALGYEENRNFFCLYAWGEAEFDKYVQGKSELSLKDIQEVGKNILRDVDAQCRQLNLRYWVCGGTLLGVVRHKGFIPWDDDIDIFLPWRDYKILMEKYKDSEQYLMLSPERSRRLDYNMHRAKIVDRRTIVREGWGIIRNVLGVWLDIYPIIGLPTDAEERHTFITSVYESEREKVEMFYADSGDMKRYSSFYEQQMLFYDKFDFDASEYVGVMLTPYKEKDCTARTVYDKTFRMPFEDVEVNVPSGYREYLDNLYGKEWEKMPDESKRQSDH